MLAMADAHGRVWGSIPGLANRARLTLPDTEAALNAFLSPDPYSRTTTNEGRRIAKIDGGWVLLNHAKYRAIRDSEAIKESKREYIRKRRAVEKASKSVEYVEHGRANAEADTEAEAESISSGVPLSPSRQAGGEFDRFWNAYPSARRQNKAGARKAWLKLKPSVEIQAAMITALEIQGESQQWQDARFIPMAATWLNQKRWEDDPEAGNFGPPSPRGESAYTRDAMEAICPSPSAEEMDRRMFDAGEIKNLGDSLKPLVKAAPDGN